MAVRPNRSISQLASKPARKVVNSAPGRPKLPPSVWQSLWYHGLKAPGAAGFTKRFMDKTGIKLVVDTYDSNEALYEKLQAISSFDPRE